MVRLPDGRDEQSGSNDSQRTDESGSGLIDRRSYLKIAATGVAAGLGAANVSTVSAQQADVNVADEGADDSGGDPINSILESNLSDGTRFVFPEGTYRLDPIRWDGYDNVTLVAPDGARLVPPSDIGTGNWMYFKEVSNFRFEGFTLDNTADGAAPAHLFNVVGGTNVIKDVTVEGYRPDRRHCMMPWCEGADTDLKLENVRLPDGNNDGAAYYITEEYLYNTNQGPGTLRFHDCYVENFSQGVYASGHGGPIEFIGGEYVNNGIDGIRLGGGNTRQALVRGVTVRVDGPADPIGEKPNMRGIWLREGEGTVVEDCDVIMTDFNGSYSAGGIVVERTHGDCVIRNTRIQVDEDCPAIKARSPKHTSGQGMSEVPDNWDVNLENVSITGSDSGDEAVRLYGRDGSSIQNCCIQQTGSDRDGIRFLSCSGCSVADSTINVTGQAVALSSASADTSNVTQDGTCPAPNSDGDSGSNTDGESQYATDMPNTIWISGDGATTSYEFEASGAAEKTIADGSTVNGGDAIDGSTVSGVTTNEADAYGFEGDIVSFASDGDPVVQINGEQVDPSSLGGSGNDNSDDGSGDDSSSPDDSTGDGSDGDGSDGDGSDGDSSLDRTLRITGGGDAVWYEFGVSGDIEKATLGDATINDFDAVDGSTVTGVTTNETDAYRFSGDITAFGTDGSPAVTVDGEQADPESLGGSSSGESDHTLWISGDGATTSYEFGVSGDIAKSTADDATINDFDAIDGSTVTGVTTNEADAYAYTGEITSFGTDGQPVVAVDGEQVDPATLGSDGSGNDGSNGDGSDGDGSDGDGSDGSDDDTTDEPLPNLVVIDGVSGTDGGYSLTVTGDLAAAPDVGELEDDDVIDGLSADGSIGNDSDAYRFSGDVDNFQLSGIASVTFDQSDS